MRNNEAYGISSELRENIHVSTSVCYAAFEPRNPHINDNNTGLKMLVINLSLNKLLVCMYTYPCIHVLSFVCHRLATRVFIGKLPATGCVWVIIAMMKGGHGQTK